MQKKEIFKKLKTSIDRKYIESEEYQDKYFLMKKLKSIFPNLTDESIYSSIESCNKQLAYPRKSEDFIKLFLNQIFPILYEKFEDQ